MNGWRSPQMERLAENRRAGNMSRRLHAGRKNPPLATGRKFREDSDLKLIRECAACCKSHTQRNSASRSSYPGTHRTQFHFAILNDRANQAQCDRGAEAHSQSAAQAVMARGWLLTKTAEAATSTAITAASAKNFIAKNFIVVAPLCAGKWIPGHCANFDIWCGGNLRTRWRRCGCRAAESCRRPRRRCVCRHRQSLRLLPLVRLDAASGPLSARPPPCAPATHRVADQFGTPRPPSCDVAVLPSPALLAGSTPPAASPASPFASGTSRFTKSCRRISARRARQYSR